MLRTLLLAMLATGASDAGQVVVENGRYKFVEDFRWQGNHAATIGTAPNQATTVWWDEASFDARGDTAYIAVEPLTDDGVDATNRFHVDIHKAMTTDARDGRISNTVNAIGGDGSAGIGIMHLDYQDIVSARVRNPMLVSASQPGVVRFNAPVFNTTGHWWEIAITPVDQLIGGEHTSVPSVNDALPFPGSTVEQPGPGHDVGPGANSVNLVAIGTYDYPCQGFPGYRTRFGVSKTLAGVKTHYVTPGQDQGNFLATAPNQVNTLPLWELRFAPDGVKLYSDVEVAGQLQLLESWPVDIPWSEVHVHLVAVAYQSTHHYAAPCNLGHIREMQWRNLSVYPVKYARTDVFPKNAGVQHVPQELGFVQYDLRDIQRFGAAVNGAPQPNTVAFSSQHPGRYCRDGGFPCFQSAPAQPTLGFTLPTAFLSNLAAARLVADLKDAAPASVHASVVAQLNGQAVGRFPLHDDVLPASEQWPEWVRRALPVPASALRAGSNSLQLTLEQGAYLDRIELELLYAGAEAAVFADGFESGTVTPAKTRAYVHPRLGELGIRSPLFPVGSGAHLLHQCAE